MSEADYETIEAAVTETVRGRWFLGEFARRNRSAELRQLLDAMARIENVVAGTTPALPPADPSIRLLMQRIKEIAGQLNGVAAQMREAGIDTRFPEAIDHQARAVAGMMRTPGRGALPPRTDAAAAALPITAAAVLEPSPLAAPQGTTAISPAAVSSAGMSASATIDTAPLPAPSSVRMPRAALPASLARPNVAAADDPRLDLLSGLDGLTLAQKLALFS